MKRSLLLITALLIAPLGALHSANADVSLVRTGTWTEFWPDAAGQPLPREVKGGLWNEAIQGALDKDNVVHLPKHDQPYYPRHHPARHHRHPRLQALRPAQLRSRSRQRLQRQHRHAEKHRL